MSYWLTDRVLPGVVASLISVVPVFVIQHLLMKRHINRVTEKQTEELRVPAGQEKEKA